MARYRATVHAPRPADQVFAYLADLRSVVEWDPAMKHAELLEGAPGSLGARYRLTVGTPGSDTVVDYEVVQLEVPHRLVLRGESPALLSVDTVTVRPDGNGGCEVVYDARLALKGVRTTDPLAGLGLARASDQARAGLARRLAQLP